MYQYSCRQGKKQGRSKYERADKSARERERERVGRIAAIFDLLNGRPRCNKMMILLSAGWLVVGRIFITNGVCYCTGSAVLRCDKNELDGGSALHEDGSSRFIKYIRCS